MEIIETNELTEEQKKDIIELWNWEYPENISHTNIDSFDCYLNELKNKKYYFTTENNKINSIAVQFTRKGESWFFIIVGEKNQRKGIGLELLRKLKSDNDKLSAWVIDNEGYKKKGGRKYKSPIEFYLKNEFRIIKDSRLENEKISAVKIEWCRKISL